jgi:halimadienyl-diphosphate synthase
VGDVGVIKKSEVIRKNVSDVHLNDEIETLLTELGIGRTEPSAYETAWVARLAPRYPQFEGSLEWLRQHQHDDGTWGAAPLFYHDRFISTLAAIVALRELGTGKRDQRRVERGERALWGLLGKLHADANDTVGFPLLALSLGEEADRLGLNVPRPPLRHRGAYDRKMNALFNRPNRNWRGSTLTFSLEGMRSAIQEGDDLFEENGSISISPAATAAYLMAHHHDGALTYLEDLYQTGGHGGIPALAPIDVFEIVWSLNHLRIAGAISPEHPVVQELLGYLWGRWSSEQGIRLASHFPVPDVDDTAAAYTMMRWGGYSPNASAFGFFEVEDHFVTFHGETDPSLSANVRLLATLKHSNDPDIDPRWIEKIMVFLHKQDSNGSFWWDKWHASPYYVTGFALRTLVGIDDELARSRLRWMLNTQRDDGGWGYLGGSTAEETAYCLEALIQWHCNVAPVREQILDEAANYLYAHIHDVEHPPLWINKGLYTPTNPIRAAILGALFAYEQMKSD